MGSSIQRLELQPGSHLGESATSGAQDLEAGRAALGRGHLWQEVQRLWSQIDPCSNLSATT